MARTIRKAAYNSTFAIGGVSFSADSLEVAESFVLRINISGKNPAHRKSARRYTANRDRDAKGLVLCAAITEQSEPGVARAEDIA